MSALPHRRLNAWVAIIVMALAALAPTVSRALARGAVAPAGWMTICTAAGMQSVAVAPEGAAPASGDPASVPGAMLDACPFCLAGADRLGLPPMSTAAPSAWGEPVAPPVATGHLSPTTTTRAPSARGPPPDTVSSFVA